ncbi:MAG: LysM peptidoglycan-binding domain-containing protein [Anaerolineae bacterium]|nr:LysM peptidoglycan-binding domain-containing protein [Anaerolineae bacterium]MDQ7035099.1 LysM peptidoglycan-binding domain-containing protein [Anaerolineae bacterium]
MTYRLLISLIFAGVLLCAPVFVTAQDNTTSDTLPELTIHVVQRGESLFRIALSYGMTVQELAELNGILDVSNLQVGQRLLVPSADSAFAIPQSHTVQPGETLSSIAELYNVEITMLIELNNLPNANQIYPGQELMIVGDIEPTLAETPDIALNPNSAQSVTIPDNGLPTLSTNLHTVQSGETLYRIALQYGLTVPELASANSITDSTRIFVGQQLIIPNANNTPEAALDLPRPIVGLDVKPLIFIEGETGFISLNTEIAATVTGQFLGRDLRSIPLDDNTQHLMFIPIPLFTDEGIYPISFNLSNSDGTQITFAFNMRVAAGGYGIQNLDMSAELQRLLVPAVQEEELNIIQRITSEVTLERYFDGAFSIPAAAAMNGEYGTRRSYNSGPVNGVHSGADFAAAPNAPIFAAASGQVVLADTLNIRGNTVVINHGWGIFTLYAHQNALNVSVGDIVTTGQIVGFAGSTGRITGPHLHWEVWVNGVPVNPLQWTQQIFP